MWWILKRAIEARLIELSIGLIVLFLVASSVFRQIIDQQTVLRNLYADDRL